MAQRRQDRYGGIKPGADICHRHAGAQRPAAFLAGDGHEAAHTLRHEIIAAARCIRPGLAKAGDRTIDQRRLDAAQSLPIQPVLHQAAHLEIFDHDIGLARQIAQQGLAIRVGEIHGNAALVAIGRQIIGRCADLVRAVHTLQKRRPPRAGIIAAARHLHLHHISAQIGQCLRAPRPGQHPRQIKDTDTGKRRRRNIINHRASLPPNCCRCQFALVVPASGQARSKIAASPCPPPMHMVSRPKRPPRRCNSWHIVARMRPPVAPIG